MSEEKKFVGNLFLCRFAIFICMTSVAIWFVFIPWKVNLLFMSESQLGFVFMIFGLGSLFSIQNTNRILLRRYSAESLIRFTLPLFPITFFFLDIIKLIWIFAFLCNSSQSVFWNYQ